MRTAGAEQKVAIADNVTLDFTGLFSEKAPESPAEPPLEDKEYKTATEQEKPTQGQTGGLEREQAKHLFLQATKGQDAIEDTLDSFQLQVEILKGIKAGEDVYTLFLKAVKAISIMTSNSLFYTQTEADLKAIYGRGLREKPPLQMEIEEAQGRLQKLREAEKREDNRDSKERIQRAIKAHEATIEKLQRRKTQP